MRYFKQNHLHLIIFSAFIISACTDFTEVEQAPLTPEEPQEKSYPNVDPQLWKYFASFEHEALIRGISIDLNAEGVSAEIEQIPEDGVAGTCHFGSQIQNHVTVDQSFWNNSNENWREFVVFHELGHCSLLRGHYEGMDSNGTCLSIMASGTQECTSRYNSVNRTTYLNELFSFN